MSSNLGESNVATKSKPKPAAAPEPVQAPAPPVMPPEVLGEVSLAQIRPCPFNIRKSFPEDDIAGLAESIRTEGLLNRLIVRPVAEPGKVAHFDRGWHCLSHFELVDGERRFRALQLVAETHGNDADGGVKVPVVIRPLTDAQVRAVMLVTREQSRDLKVTELVAGYADLRERLGSDGAVAAAVGKPVAHVRGLLRLARLPGWALAAVDSGTLPRATAELVARVPGEVTRKRAAYCVATGASDPREFEGRWTDDPVPNFDATPTYEPLSYRDTKDLIRNHFTKELKGAPFSLTVLYPEPGDTRELPSCAECPKRAGNDPEAVAEGTRADVCLDPDCYRSKLAAFRADELARAAEKGIEEAPIDGGFHTPPKGWCDLEAVIWMGDLRGDFPVGPNQHPKREEELRKVLGAKCPTAFIEFDHIGKPVFLVRTEDARKVLRELGVLKRPERAKEVPSTDTGSKPVKAATNSAKTSGPSDSKVAEGAVAIAGRVLAEFAQENFDDLDVIEQLTGEEPHTSAVWEAFRFVARFLIRDHIAFGPERGVIVERALALEHRSTLSPAGRREADVRLNGLGHRAALALCVRLAAECELQSAPRGPFGMQLLEWAELNWEQLEQQARRELSGEEKAEEKIAKAEAEQATPVGSDASTSDPMLTVTTRVPGLTDYVVSKLVAVSVDTVGQLCEWADEAGALDGGMAQHNGVGLMSALQTLGIAQRKASEAGDAVYAFLKQHGCDPRVPQPHGAMVRLPDPRPPSDTEQATKPKKSKPKGVHK